MAHILHIAAHGLTWIVKPCFLFTASRRLMVLKKDLLLWARNLSFPLRNVPELQKKTKKTAKYQCEIVERHETHPSKQCFFQQKFPFGTLNDETIFFDEKITECAFTRAIQGPIIFPFPQCGEYLINEWNEKEIPENWIKHKSIRKVIYVTSKYTHNEFSIKTNRQRKEKQSQWIEWEEKEEMNEKSNEWTETEKETKNKDKNETYVKKAANTSGRHQIRVFLSD